MKAGWIMKFPPAYSVLVALFLGLGAVHGGDTAEDWPKLKGNGQPVALHQVDGRAGCPDEVKAVKLTVAGADKRIFLAAKITDERDGNHNLRVCDGASAIDLFDRADDS